MLFEFQISSNDRIELIDITQEISEIVAKSKAENGLCVVYVPHATAALIVNENEDGLKQDILKFVENLIPKDDYLHNRIDDNAEAHIAPSIIGTEKTFVIENSKLLRGAWQNIFFVELDGPRNSRRIIIKIISD